VEGITVWPARRRFNWSYYDPWVKTALNDRAGDVRYSVGGLAPT